MKPKDIDHIIDLISKINKLFFRDFQNDNERKKYLDKYAAPLQKELDLFFNARIDDLYKLCTRPKVLELIDYEYIIQPHIYAPPFPPKTKQQDEEERRSERKAYTDIVIQELKRIKAKLEYSSEQKTKPVENLLKTQSWHELSLDVIDDDTVRYKIGKGKWQRANYAELGFKDERSCLPNKLWRMFKTLAENCKNQSIECHTQKNISKDIDRICDTLKKFFGPQERPIRYNRKNKNWKVAFKLTFKSQDSTDS